MNKGLNIIFAGTPEFAAAALQSCINSHHNIVAVYTQPDRPAGRGQKISYSPVKQLALDANIPVFQPQRFAKNQIEQLKTTGADIMLVSAYGMLLPKNVLEIPKLGCINIHASLLPKWRGAAPIQRAIIAGDTQTGISIMQMVEALDAGPVLQSFTCDINANDTGKSLHDRLAKIAADEIVNVLDRLQKRELQAVVQDESRVSYANKLSKQEANINWDQTAVEIERKIRAFNAWPVAYSYLNDQRVRIWQAELCSTATHAPPGAIVTADKDGIQVATGESNLILTTLQLAGGKVISAQDFINAHNVDGQQFKSETTKNTIRASA